MRSLVRAGVRHGRKDTRDGIPARAGLVGVVLASSLALAAWQAPARAAAQDGASEAATAQEQGSDPAPELSWRPIEIALWTPVNIFHPDHKLVGGLSFNILYGSTTAMAGIEIGAGLNRQERWMAGLQIGATANNVKGNGYGIQLAGVTNVDRGSFYGIQGAGIVNVTDGGCAGICVAGIVNLHDGAGGGLALASVYNRTGDYVGLQLAAFHNWARGDFSGLQLAAGQNSVMGEGVALQIGVTNLGQRRIMWGLTKENPDREAQLGGMQIGVVNAAHNFAGVQIGVLNFGRHTLRGLHVGGAYNQVAPFGADEPSAGMLIAPINVSADYRGVQLGLVNVAGEVKGLQIGVFNYASRIKGLQIGLLNVAPDNTIPFLPVVNAGF